MTGVGIGFFGGFGLNLNINKGEIHVIMGPNGAGKSTLANCIFNNPEYKKMSGKIIFEE
jgi:Fe-S cluster assembly ATP-binding protein